MIGTFAVLCFGIVCSSMSFVFIRESVEPSAMLAAWRVLLSAIMLLPVYVMMRRRYGDLPLAGVLKRSLIPGVILAVHFILWVMGARLTPGANANLIVNLNPLVMPLVLYLMFGERLQIRELLATLLALLGLYLLAAGDVKISRDHAIGDLLCLGSMVLFALYLAMARRHAQLPSIWLYLVPLYAVAGIVATAIAATLGPITPTLEARNVGMVLALAAVSTVIGHSALNLAMQRLRGQTVTVMNMFQFVVAGAIAYVLYNEVPPPAFYPASALMLIGLALVVWNQRLNKAAD